MIPLPQRWRRVAIALFAVVIVFGIAGALALPALARWGLETVASRELGRAVHVDTIRANPYTLRITLRGLSVAGAAGETAPLLTAREAIVNASVTSVFRGAPVADGIAIDGLVLNVARLEPQRFNFTDIVERIQAKPSKEPARFSLANIQMTDGTVNFDDRVTGSSHAATNIKIGIPFLSNLPTDVEIKVQPAFAAQINGTPVALTGETRPFDESHESSINLQLNGLDVRKYLAFSPVKLDFEIPAGKLSTDLRVAFREAVPRRGERPAAPARMLVSGSLQFNDFEVRAPAGPSAASLIGWKSLAFAIEEFEPLRRHLVISDVTIEAPDVAVARDRQGILNWQRFIQHPLQQTEPTAAEVKAAPAVDQPYAFTLKHGAVNGGRIRFVDEQAGRFEQEFVDLKLEGSALSTTSAARGALKLASAIKDNGTLSLDGELGLAPIAGRLNFAARDVRLVAAARYLANVLDGTLDGSSDIDAVLELAVSGAEARATLRDISLVGKDIKLRGPQGSGAAFDIASLMVSGGAIDLAAQRVTIDRVALDAPRLVVRRQIDGTINWQHLVRAKASSATSQPQTAKAPWTFRVDHAEIARGDMSFEDQAVEPAVKLRASALTATLKNLAGDGSERAEFSLQTRFGSGGSLSAQGNARWDALAATVRVDARNLDIAALRPYLAARLNATLAHAELSGRGTVGLAQASPESPVKVNYAGNARLANLHLLDGAGESDLLKWQVFDVQNIDAKTGDGAPFVALGKLTLSDFYARVIVTSQGRINLADLVKRNDGAPAAAAASPSAQMNVVDANAARPTIRIGAIELVRGNVNFTDNFIKPNYTANMTGLGGVVTTLASDSSEPATMTLAGRIDDDAPVEIAGRLNPLAPSLYLDIEGRTKGVDLPRLTPYAVKYAGYPITKGKLSMDVRYKVEDQKLAASNHLFLDQLTFGERIDSPTATKLPVLLAVSLLKNTRGEIDLNLPISGSLNDPEFSVGGIVVQIIVNLLTKVVTAPFALLAAAFGGNEEIGYVEFAPGDARIAPPQVQRLDTLAKALNDRPALRVDIIGRVDPATDADGVRRAKYESKLRAAKVRQLARSGESVDPTTVTISADERPSLIAAVYADENIPDKPRNVIGFAKSVPPPEMEQLILTNMPATPEDLRALATARAGAVRNQLESNGKVSRDRLFLVEPKLSAEGIQDKGATTRVDFSLK